MVSLKVVQEIFSEISDKFDIPLDEIYKISGERVSRPNIFASPQAKMYFVQVKANRKNLIGTGSGGKITIDDVRKSIGENIKQPEGFSSAAAKKLAGENKLTSKDFPVHTRNGRVFKCTGEPSITIDDVRLKIGVITKPKSPSGTKKTKKSIGTKKTNESKKKVQFVQ